MPEKTHATLRELQEIDRRIAEIEDRIRDFDPLFAEVDEPAIALEGEANTTRGRLKEMKIDERRVELAVEEKRQRIKRLQERLTQVRNVREEAAVSTEIDMLKSALEGEEQEAYSLIDQIRRFEIRLSEQEKALEDARAAVEPRQQELLAERDEAKKELDRLKEERRTRAGEVAPSALRLYEGIRGTKRRQAVAELTADGACANCFSVIPLQLQNEVRTGGQVVRCEACGVILTRPKPEPEPEPESESESDGGSGSDEGA